MLFRFMGVDTVFEDGSANCYSLYSPFSSLAEDSGVLPFPPSDDKGSTDCNGSRPSQLWVAHGTQNYRSLYKAKRNVLVFYKINLFFRVLTSAMSLDFSEITGLKSPTSPCKDILVIQKAKTVLCL